MQKEWLNLSYYGLRLFVHQRALFVIGNTDDPAKQEVLTGLGFSEIPQMRHPERGAYWRLPPELANNSALHGLAKGFPHARIELTPVSEVVPGSSVAPRSQLENTHANRQQQLHNSETGAANAPQPAVARAAGSAQQDSDRPDTGQRGSAVHPDSRPDNRGRDEAVPVVEDGTPDHQRAESAQDAGNQQAGGDSLSGLPGKHSGPLPGTRAAAGVPVAGEQPDAAQGDASQLDESIQTGGQGNLDQRSGQRADLTQAFSQYLAARLAQFESLDDQESETRAAELQAAIQSPYRPDASSPLAVLSHPAFAAAQADSLTGPDALAAIAPDERFDEQAIAQAWAVVEQAKASLPPLSEMEIMLGQQRTGANLFAQALKDHDPQLAADLESAVTRAEFVVQSNLAAAQETAMLAHLQQPEQPAESPQASELEQPEATEEPEQTPEPEVDPGDQMAIHITASEPVPEPLIREYFGLAEEQPLVVPFSAVKSFMVQYFQIPDADCMERLGDAVHQPLDDPAGLTYVVDVSELHTVLAPAPVAGAEQTQQEQPEFEPETAAEQEAEQAQSEPETKREAEAEPEVEPETVEYAPVPNIVIDGPVTSAKVGQAIRQGWELYAEAGWEYGEVYPIVLSVGEQQRYMMVSTTDKTNDTKALSAYSLAPSAVIGDNLLSMDRFDVSRNDGVVREPTYLAYRPEVADDWRECFERVGFPVFTEEMLTNPGLYFEEHWHSQVKAPLVSPEEFAKHIADISSRAVTENMEPPAPAPEWSEQDQQQTDLFAEPAPAEETPDIVELPKSVQVNIAGDLHSEVFGVLEAEAAGFRAEFAQMDEDDDDYHSLEFAIGDLPKARYALRRDVEDGVLSRFASYKDDYVKTYEALEAGIGRQAQLLAAAAQEQMAHVDGERSFVRALYTGISNPHDLFALQAQAEASGLKAKGSVNDLLVAGALAHTVVNSAEYTDALQRETAMDRSLVEAMSYVESGIQMAMVGADGQTITNMEAQQIPDFLPAGMWIRQPEEMGRQERWLQIVPADRDSAEHVHYNWHWMTNYEDGRPNRLNIYAAGLINRDADNPAKGVGQWLYTNTLQGHRALQSQADRLMDGYVGRLGTNAEGGSVRVDENGVRFYYEDGFRVSEPVAVDMGGTGASRPKQSREGTGYETTVEIAYREERAQQARETQEAQQAEANQPETETAQETGTGEVNYQYAADNPQLGGMYEHAVIDDKTMPTNVNRVWLADQPVTVAQGERIVDSKVVVAPTVLTKHDREMINAPGLPGEVKAWRATIVDGEQGLRCLFEAEVSTHNYDRDNNVLRSAFALVDSELGYLAKKVPALFIEADHMLAQARELMADSEGLADQVEELVAEGERPESQALFEQAEPELEQAPAEPATNEPQDAPASMPAPASPQAETSEQPVVEALPEFEPVAWSGVRREHLEAALDWSDSSIAVQIAALKQIEADGIHTDAEDLSVIVRALQFNEGWGAFTVGANRWVTQQAAKELDMSEAEFSRYVVEHRNESYYTQLPMVDAMWKVVEKAGIPTNSRILEPACGAGIFVAGAPAEYQDNARFMMIDKDRVATRFAQALLPQATVINDRLEATLFERNFGAVISNVPFGQARITDNEYNDKPYVHDYFIRRAVNALEPGGVAVLVTSRGFMDRASPDVRQDVMATSDLIGAVRMPDNMFASAGAQVVTDILVFQKRKPGCTPLRDFTQVEEISRSFGDESITMRVNSFFAQHPENVLGELSIRSGPYGDEPTIEANMDYHEIYAALEERLGEQVSEGIYEAARNRVPDLVEEADQVGVQSWDSNAYPAADTHADGLVVGQYMLDNDVPVEVVGFKPSYDQNGVQSGVSPLVSRLTLGQRHERLVRAFIPLRDATIELAKAQVGGTDEQLAAAQAEALALYESFVKSFGPVNASNNYRIIGEDPTGSEVLSLETYDPKERVVVSLADTFTKRVIGSNHQTGKVQTAEDAYWASMDRTGTADFELMEELSGLSQDDLKAELVGRFVFLNPESREFESEDVYLSGNVVQKLDMAVKAAELDPGFKANVTALERVRPQLKAFDDIFYNLGSNWIPADMVRDWVLDQAGLLEASDHDFKVVYDDHTGSWDVVASTSFRNRNKVLFNSTFGTPRAHMGALLKHALSGTAPTFRMKDEEGKNVVDMELTQQAADMIKVINSSFKEWVAQDGGRREQIEELYNNKINVFAVPKYNGEHLTFPGLAEGWVPRKHQVDFISRMLRGYNCGSGHPVGAGKTLEMVAGAMKLKQSGQFNKPVAAIPNHMLQQFTREAKMLYPSAKILMVTRQDLSADNRARFLSVTRNNDWDLVVMTHSMVNEMLAPIDIQLENIREQLDTVGVHMEAAMAQGDKRVQKRLADRKSTLEAQITAIEAENKLLERGESKSRRMFIAETGIDCLLIDEAHAYKNLNLNTGLDVLGINKGGSQRALNMEQLASYMRSIHGGQSKGVFYFTGTPITNTMAEGYVMVKYLRPDYWESIGCKHFDNWMKNFGVIESQVEVLVEGSQVGVRQRATSFDGSFRPIFHEVWDIKLPEELGLPTPDVEYEMVEVQPTKLQEKFQDHLAIRATAIRDGKVKPTEDNLLVVSMDGSKGAIDLQLIDPRIPDELSGNKLDVAAQRIKGFWEDTHEQKGTQLVFLDLGVYKGPNEFSLYSKLRDKLVEQGLPAEEVAFIHEAGSSAKKKEDIFAKVRSGEIRVLVGSSEKMGVGTNIQDRLIALHSLDVPWRPDITTQRNGRINRQGNLFFEKVHILNYIAHNSSEAGRAQKNKYKHEMQRQALRNEDYATDVIFDENNEISYEEWMAAATGEPKIAEHAQVQAEYESMCRSKGIWERQQSFLRTTKLDFERSLNRIEREIEQAQRVQQGLPHASMQTVEVRGEVVGIQDGDTSWFSTGGYDKNQGLAAALKRRVETTITQLMRSGGQNSRELGVSVGAVEFHVRPHTFLRGVYNLIGFTGEDVVPNLVSEITKESMTTGLALANRTRKTWEAAGWVKEYENQRVDIQARLENLAEPATEWPNEAELERLGERYQELSEWMQKNDFSARYREMQDPFLEYMRALDATCAQELSDQLETDLQTSNGETLEPDDAIIEVEQYHHTEESDGALVLDDAMLIDTNLEQAQDSSLGVKQAPPTPGLSVG